MDMTFHISLSGLNAAARRLAITANNIANISTPAYKSRQARLADVAAGGVKISSIGVNFSQGPLQISDGRFSLAIDGIGFFKVQSPAGVRFTRAGNFVIDASGNIVTPEGYMLLPQITIPENTISVNVNQRGEVFAISPDGQATQIGQIYLYRFANPQGLIFEGENLVSTSPSSGEPVEGLPQQGGFGRILFGYLEGSNVELSSEMVSLLINRAFFRANLASLQAQNRMLGSLFETIT
jgi:flagellar basal-body rod protein FlgG